MLKAAVFMTATTLKMLNSLHSYHSVSITCVNLDTNAPLAIVVNYKNVRFEEIRYFDHCHNDSSPTSPRTPFLFPSGIVRNNIGICKKCHLHFNDISNSINI